MLGQTVEQLLAGMTAEEYLDWDAFLAAEAELRKHEEAKRQKGIAR
jgi:hypothetical protein